jgi:hypothetical protein
MEFKVTAKAFSQIPDDIALREIWDIDDRELSEIGRSALELLAKPPQPLRDVFQRICWQWQALIELQDIQGMPVPKKGSFLNTSYLYCQFLFVQRQVIIAAINGQVHVALAGLRSAFETFVYHYWWRSRLEFADSYDDFNDWLMGKKGQTPFSQVRRDLFGKLPYPSKALSEDDFCGLYSDLCAYAHKPKLDQSLLSIRSSNITSAVDAAELVYWLSLTAQAQRLMLDLAVSQNPLALFPVDVYRKFGFNPPAGIFLDTYSGPIVEKAFGPELYEDYQKHFAKLDPPESQLGWFEDFPSLTEEQILASSKDDVPPRHKDPDFRIEVLRRATAMKAHQRAIIWAFSHMPPGTTPSCDNPMM